MKALIVLENHFTIDDNNNVWCDRVVDYNYLKRYLNVFSSITVIGRCVYTSDDCSNKLLVSGDNVDFISLPDFQGINGVIKNYFKIRNIFKTIITKVDCVIMRCPTHLSFIVYDLIHKNGKPYSIEFMMDAGKMIEGKFKIFNPCLVHIAKKICLDADGVSYVTKNTLQNKYPCKALTSKSKTGYFTEYYSSIDLNDKLFMKPQKSNNKTFTIIHTGYMDSYRKGQDTLIKAISLVIKDGYKNIKLILVGDGEKKNEFKNMVNDLNISDYVEFTGIIKQKDDIIQLLRNSDLFVFPTHSEGLPRSIIEAMANGLPCIASPVDGIPELINNDCLIDYNDYIKYSKKIEYFIDNSNARYSVGLENYNKSLEYRIPVLEKRRTSFYNELKMKANKQKKIKKQKEVGK